MCDHVWVYFSAAKDGGCRTGASVGGTLVLCLDLVWILIVVWALFLGEKNFFRRSWGGLIGVKTEAGAKY